MIGNSDLRDCWGLSRSDVIRDQTSASSVESGSGALCAVASAVLVRCTALQVLERDAHPLAAGESGQMGDFPQEMRGSELR